MKKIIKLKDMTKEQYVKWRMVYKNSNNCSGTCEKCPLRLVHCHPEIKECWIYHTEMFTDKFLNKTIEIEVPDVLDEKEKEYLSAVIKPFRNRVSCIKKVEFHDKYFISIKVYSSFNLSQIECIDLPIFMSNIYKGMEGNKCYTLEELGL